METTWELIAGGIWLLAIICVVASLVRLGLRSRGGTLLAPVIWAVVATMFVCGVELVGLTNGGSDAAWLPAVRFIAAVSTLCPAIALLGAKRPQSRAWQFIVLTLFGILVQPAIVALLLHYGEPVTLHAARQWFLAVLMLIGVINYLPTRYALSGVLVCAAQILLLWGHLPFTEFADGRALAGVERVGAESWREWLPGLLLIAAVAIPQLGWPRGKSSVAPWDQLWIDFRNAYGIVWALRLGERLNATLAASGQSARLGWHGFECAALASSSEKIESTAKSSPPESAAAAPDEAARRALVALLRRFVSKEWIAARADA